MRNYFEGSPKLRVSTAQKLSGTVNPVTYEIIDYNNEIEYHAGVIIIMQPGWYTCTASSRGDSGNSASSALGIYIIVENREKSYGNR